MGIVLIPHDLRLLELSQRWASAIQAGAVLTEPKAVGLCAGVCIHGCAASDMISRVVAISSQFLTVAAVAAARNASRFPACTLVRMRGHTDRLELMLALGCGQILQTHQATCLLRRVVIMYHHTGL